MAHGDGRLFTRKSSHYWRVAFYHASEEQREVARYLKDVKATKKGDKILAGGEETREAAQAYLD